MTSFYRGGFYRMRAGQRRPERVGGAPASPFAAEAITLFAAMSPAPTDARKALINNFIKSLQGSGLWPKIDILYVLAAHDAQAAGLNWKNPASFVLTAVNSPGFVADQGYAGNGTSSYMDTGWDPATNGVAYLQDSASLFAWSLTDSRLNATAVIGARETGKDAYINPWNSSVDSVSHGINGSGADAFAPGSAAGLFALSRQAAANYAVYRNTSLLGTQVTASAAPTSVDFRICGAGGSSPLFTNRRVALGGAGGGLSSGEEAALHAAANTYLAAVGAV